MASVQLAFTNDVTPIKIGDTLDLVVEIRDEDGTVQSGDTSTVTFAQVGGTGAVTGLGAIPAVAGIATLTVTASVYGDVVIDATDGLLTLSETTLSVAYDDVAPVVAGYDAHVWTREDAKEPSAVHMNAIEQALASQSADAIAVQGTIATATDATPPSSSPAPIVQGGVSFLAVTWPQVANADLIAYEVHISTTDAFTPDETTFAGRTAGSNLVIRTMPDGSALIYNTSYYVKIVAVDADGAASASVEGIGQLVQANSPDIAANSITADHILVSDALIGDLVSQVIRTAAPGATRVELDSVNGLTLYIVQGGVENIFVRFPLDGSNPIVNGDLVASSITINDMMTMLGSGNAISKGAKLTLGEGVSAPLTPPAMAVTWDTLRLGGGASTIPRFGLYYDAAGDAGGATQTFLTVEDRANGLWTLCEYKYASTGVAGDLLRTATWTKVSGDVVSGVVRMGTSIYVLWKTGGIWTIRKFAQSNLALQASVQIGTSPTGTVGFGTDGTNLLVAYGSPPTFPSTTVTLALEKWDSTMGFVSIQFPAGITSATTLDCYGVSLGPAAGTLYLRVNNAGTNIVRAISSTTFANVANEDFYANAAAQGITYDGTRFWAGRGVSAFATKHSTWTWTDATSAQYWIAYSWMLADDNLGTATVTIATPAVFSLVAHGLAAGDEVFFTTTGALPTGLVANTHYYVIAAGLTANAFEVAATRGGVAINTSGTQSGVHTLHRTEETQVSPIGGMWMSLNRRAKLAITRPNFPPSVDSFRVYAFRGATKPATTAMLRQAAPTYIDSEVAQTTNEFDFNTAGAAPMTYDSFPAGATPAELLGTGSQISAPWSLKGDGRMRLPKLTSAQRDGLSAPESSTVVTVPGQGAWEYDGAWRQIGGLWAQQSVASTPVTLVDGSAPLVLADSSATGAMTINLPAAPTAGSFFVIEDYANTAGTNSITIGRNGKNMDGLTTAPVLSVNGQRVTLWYDGLGWHSLWGADWVVLGPYSSIQSLTATTRGGARRFLVLCDTSGGAFTLSLDASPEIGETVMVVDSTGSFGVNPLTVGNNTKTIDGFAGSYGLNAKYASGTFVWDGFTWHAHTTGQQPKVQSKDGFTTGLGGLVYVIEVGNVTAAGTLDFNPASQPVDGSTYDRETGGIWLLEANWTSSGRSLCLGYCLAAFMRRTTGALYDINIIASGSAAAGQTVTWSVVNTGLVSGVLRMTAGAGAGTYILTARRVSAIGL